MHGPVDLLVVGGGAGASWGGPAGWSAFVHVPATGETKKLVGAQDDTTIQRADLLAFVAAIQWYHNRYGHLRDDGVVTNVVCCTDSVYLARAGMTRDQRVGEDWPYLEWLEARGYHITWRWTSRDQCAGVYQEAENARRTFIASLQRSPAPIGTAG